MGHRRSNISIILCSILMVVLILDSKTALDGALGAVNLCITTVIPPLFPMMVLSSLLTDRISMGVPQAAVLLNKIISIPKGCEGILAPAFLGGYPVGAACIASQYRSGSLSKQDAQHMLSFCSNAGPSFIFGVCANLFKENYTVWLLWMIHIASAIMVGICQNHAPHQSENQNIPTRTITQIVKTSTGTMAYICGWIILFRVLIQITQKWLLWLFPSFLQAVIAGSLELTNGCLMLGEIPSEAVRFVLCSILLSIGGICVFMQTTAIIAPLSPKSYCIGKFKQTLFSGVLSVSICNVIYAPISLPLKLIVSAFILFVALILLYYFKKTVAIFRRMRYNTMELCRKR